MTKTPMPAAAPATDPRDLFIRANPCGASREDLEKDSLGFADNRTHAEYLIFLAGLQAAYDEAIALVQDNQCPLHNAIALLEHSTDKLTEVYGRQLTQDLERASTAIREALSLPKPATLGLAEFAVDRPGAPAAERGDELLLAVERAAREVVRRELTPGGLIALAIGGQPNAEAPLDPNTGHGHVFPRPDGRLARCGGPGCCRECAADAAQKEASNG